MTYDKHPVMDAVKGGMVGSGSAAAGPVPRHEPREAAGLPARALAVGALHGHDREVVAVVELEGHPGGALREAHLDDLVPRDPPGHDEVAHGEALGVGDGPDAD